MTTDKVQCGSCKSSILESTKLRSNGFCTPCFMELNYGFRPSEVDSLKERGLIELAIEWKKIIRSGKPNERNPLKAEKLNKGYSEIYLYLEDYFLSNNSKLRGNEILNIMIELEPIANSEIKNLISKVKSLTMKLMKA